MKRNHVRWLTAIITTALLLFGAGLPAKAQLVVSDPSVIASNFVNIGKEIAQAKRQYDEFVRLYGQVADFISTCNDVKEVYDAIEDLSKIPDAVLRNQRNNKYLYDFEKIGCRNQTMAILKQCMSLVKDVKKITRSDLDTLNDRRLKLSDGERLSLVKELKDEIVALRNRAYSIVYKYDRISEYRAKEAGTRRLFDKLNGYK